MLEMHGISKIYRTDLIETHALRDFSLEVGDGEFVAVTGPSGSGKTTFLNVAGLLETFDTGNYKLDGEDVSRLSDDARSRLRNEKIGFIFQSFNLIPDLDVFDNVDVPLRYRGLTKRRSATQRIKSALDVVGLVVAHAPHTLAALRRPAAARRDRARARRATRRFLLADEPTGNLDSLMARQVMDLLEQINEMGTTIIMVTHDPELARARTPQRAHRRRPDLGLQAVRAARRGAGDGREAGRGLDGTGLRRTRCSATTCSSPSGTCAATRGSPP